MKRRSKVQENLKSSSPGLFWGAPPAHADIINFVATYKSEACEQKLYVTFNFILKGIMTLPSNHSSWWRRLSPSSSEDVLIKTNIFALVLRLQKTSWSRPIYSSWPYVFKASSRRFQNVLQKRLQDIFKTSRRRFCSDDVFKTSSRLLAKISSRRLQNVFKTSVKTSSRHFQDVFKTFSIHLQDVFNTSSRRLARMPSRCFESCFVSSG